MPTGTKRQSYVIVEIRQKYTGYTKGVRQKGLSASCAGKWVSAGACHELMHTCAERTMIKASWVRYCMA